jgi:hypothetical protein
VKNFWRATLNSWTLVMGLPLNSRSMFLLIETSWSGWYSENMSPSLRFYIINYKWILNVNFVPSLSRLTRPSVRCASSISAMPACWSAGRWTLILVVRLTPRGISARQRSGSSKGTSLTFRWFRGCQKH